MLAVWDVEGLGGQNLDTSHLKVETEEVQGKSTNKEDFLSTTLQSPTESQANQHEGSRQTYP
jgi:hypothetical protein